MKDSSIDWIPTIPDTWQTMPYKRLFKEMDRPVQEGDDIITCFRDGEVTLRRNRRTEGFTMADKEIGYQHISQGDLVVHGMDGFAGSIGISDSDGKATPVLIVLNPLHDEYSRYFMYLLRVYAQLEVFLATSSGIRVRSCALNWKKLGNLPAIVPSVEEQKRIVDYIDKRCSKIDEVKQTLTDEIEALQRLRKSTIHKAVTKGLDDSVPMKDSGVEWIGEIPETWALLRLKHVTSKVERGTTPDYTTDEMTPVVNQATFSKGFFDTSNLRYSSVPAITSRGLLMPGDVLIASTGGGVLGKTHYFVEQGVYVADSHVTVVRADGEAMLGKLIYYCFSINYDYFNAMMAQGSTNQIELQRDCLRDMVMPVPVLDEQRRIADYLDQRCAAIDSVIETRTEQLERLEDYRKALIFAYVTGKKEVPAHE